MSSIHIHNLTVSYQRHPAIHHVHGEFAAGSLTAVIGPNGAGKSTLLKTIVGLQQPDSGEVRLQNCSLADIAFLPQQAQIDRSFPITILELVTLGHWRNVGWFGGLSRQQKHSAEAALAQVGLTGFEDRPIGSLSVGQFQRALFARLLVQDAPVILLDEPFAALDHSTTHDLLHLVSHWQEQGRTVIAVVHDYSQVQDVFSSALLLARECIAWGDTATVLTQDNLAKAQHMAAAWRENAPVCHQD